MHGNNEFDNPTGLAFDIDNHCMWCVDICSLSLSTEIQNKSIVNFYSSFVKWKLETVNNINRLCIRYHSPQKTMCC